MHKKGVWGAVLSVIFLSLSIFLITMGPSQPKLNQIVPLHNGPLSVSQDFNLTEGQDGFVFSGQLKNQSQNDINIQTLTFTFLYKGQIYRSDGYLNIVVPANGVYDFSRKVNAFFYGDFYKTDYQYVMIKINNVNQYLKHSNYAAVEQQYQDYVEKEEAKLAKQQNTMLIIGIIVCVVSAVGLACCVFSIIKSSMAQKGQQNKNI